MSKSKHGEAASQWAHACELPDSEGIYDEVARVMEQLVAEIKVKLWENPISTSDDAIDMVDEVFHRRNEDWED